MTMETPGRRVKRRSAYHDFDLYGGQLAKLPHPTRKQAVALARRIWRRAVGKAWPGSWKAGRGNHRTYPRGRVYLVNPGQGWNGIIHDMSHTAYLYLTRRKRDYREVCSAAALADYASVPAKGHHTLGHAWLERRMVAHALELLARPPALPTETVTFHA